VLKTAAFGYDGKGQVAVAGADEVAAAWDTLGRREAILEAFVDLDREISVIGARGVDGAWSHFGPIENAHRCHILDVSVAPADVPPGLAALAIDITRQVMEGLEYIGLMCVEFFIAKDGRLLVNELAPRPHNSGHLTFDACRTSQFEQQLRAICGLPLGSPECSSRRRWRICSAICGGMASRTGRRRLRTPASSFICTVSRRRAPAARWGTSPRSPRRQRPRASR
jgi:5-(carboxyamino)imidazole ribonucleotide synthase